MVILTRHNYPVHIEGLNQMQYLFAYSLGCTIIYLCHGMTKSVKLVKVHRKDQLVNKNSILASFVCFFNFPDRNLIILYKFT